jgi:hypothetical protein
MACASRVELLLQRSSLAFRLGLAFVFVVLASCTPMPPADRGEATNRLVGNGLARVGSVPNRPTAISLTFGLGLMAQTQRIGSQKICEGAVGSLLPPLSAACVSSFFSIPGLFAAKLSAASSRQTLPENHVYLTGIEKYWVGQNQYYDCWAAVLETARKYLHLHPVSQSLMLDNTKRMCPQLERQKSADAYQITYAISSILAQYDRLVANPHLCPNEACIIESLTSGHPVIMLQSGSPGHAVLVVGMDFVVGRSSTPNEPLIIIDHIFILDPDPKVGPVVQSWTTFSLCKADAFIAY